MILQTFFGFVGICSLLYVFSYTITSAILSAKRMHLKQTNIIIEQQLKLLEKIKKQNGEN